MAKPKILQQLNAETSSQILLKEDPDVAMEAATKQYVDNSGGVVHMSNVDGIMLTYDQIVEEYNKGKIIKLHYYDDAMFTYTTYELYSYLYYEGQPLYFLAQEQFLSDNLANLKKVFVIYPSNEWETIYYNYQYTSGTLYKNGGNTPISSSTRYYRPILTSLQAPTSTDGQVGDIWIVYNNE